MKEIIMFEQLRERLPCYTPYTTWRKETWRQQNVYAMVGEV